MTDGAEAPPTKQVAGYSSLGGHQDDLIPGLTKMAEAVHQYDSKIVMQINHAGRHTASATIGETPVAPSAVFNPATNEMPREFTEKEIVNKWKQGDLKKADCISCNGCLKYRNEPVRCIQLD